MKDITKITRRSFMKSGGGGIAVLAIIPRLPFGRFTKSIEKKERTYAWSTAIEEEAKLRNEVSDLMKKTRMDIEYYPRALASLSHIINPSQIRSYDMPVEKLYEARKRLTEFIKEATENPENHGEIPLYEWMDLSRPNRC